MTSAHKEQLKQLKAPDQFQVRVMSVMDWAVKNVRLLLYVAVPVVLVVAGSFVWQYIQAQKKNSRIEALGKVEVVYDAESRKAADARELIAKQVQAIDAQIASAGKAAPAAGDKPAQPAAPATPDPKLVANKAALQKQAEAIKPDHQESSAKFVEFYKKNEAQPEGWLAAMMASRIFIDEEKFADARPLLEQVVAKSTGNTFYQTQARLELVGVLEELGDYDKGLAEVDALDKIVDADLKPRVLLSRGRLQMLKNAKADAKASFSTLIETYGTSPEAQKARSLIALLNG